MEMQEVRARLGAPQAIADQQCLTINRNRDHREKTKPADHLSRHCARKTVQHIRDRRAVYPDNHHDCAIDNDEKHVFPSLRRGGGSARLSPRLSSCQNPH
eukprot:1655935-Rhodomonas_salina.2